MKLNRQFFLRVATGLGTATLLSLSVSGFAFWSIMLTLASNRSVQEKVETIDLIGNITDRLTEAENGERGYVLTGENKYLDSYTTALLNLDHIFDLLRRLLVNEPDKKSQLERLQTLADKQITQTNQIIKLRRNQGLEAAMLAIKRHQEITLTDQIRQLANNLDAQERAILFQRQQEAANSLQRSIVAFVGGIAFNLLIFTWVYRLIYDEIRKRMTAEQNIQQLNAALEQRVTERTKELATTLRNLQQTQSQLVQQEKMSSLGVLVAGVAHEINNPVNFIHGNLTYLNQYFQDLLKMLELYHQRHPPHDPEIIALADEIDLEFLQQDLQNILASMNIGTERIRKIVLSLRNFSRLDESEFKEVDIHEGIESTLLILQHRLKAQSNYAEIEVIKNYTNLPPIQCYPGPLNQVFMNILVNAIDALEEANTNRTSEKIKNSLSQILIRTSVVDSDWVEIAIADNGLGIPEAVQEKIFEPFFTTKPVGKGTGMGMSISHQIIVTKHSGKLICDSTPGKGTKFTIQLPINQSIFDYDI
jgi:signal transduction histidine kinase